MKNPIVVNKKYKLNSSRKESMLLSKLRERSFMMLQVRVD